MGFTLEVSTTCTDAAAGAAFGGNDRRLGLFCSRHHGLSRRLCARQIFFQLLDRL